VTDRPYATAEQYERWFGQEGKLHARRRCTRCTLAARLGELLDDGTGRVRPELRVRPGYAGKGP
jgi:hypothetical protein